MQRLAVFSGKGGTGKTTLVAAFARLTERVVAADCDVDAANLALLLPGVDEPSRPFMSGQKAQVQDELCLSCGKCIPHCRFGALGWVSSVEVAVAPLACEGCEVCVQVCPGESILMLPNQAGTWTRRALAASHAPDAGWLVHAELGVAQDNSGKLVTEVRSQADALARTHGIETVLIDGPPGIGCAVHAAMGQVSRILVVTEPTPSGEHDLLRLLETARQFHVPACVAINKHDLSPGGAAAIEAACAARGIEVIGRVPFDAAVPAALARGEVPLGAAVAPETDAAIRALWERFSTGGCGDAARHVVVPRLHGGASQNTTPTP